MLKVHSVLWAVHFHIPQIQRRLLIANPSSKRSPGRGGSEWDCGALFSPVVSVTFQAPHQPGQPGFKFTVAESCDRIKDEFQFLQAQYHR